MKSLPDELWVAIMALLPVVDAMRAQCVSRTLCRCAQVAVADAVHETRRLACPDENAAVRALIDAIARDDVDRLARILMTGTVSPHHPVFPPDFFCADLYTAPRLCTGISPSRIDRNKWAVVVDRKHLFGRFAAPTTAGWTPLNMAVAFCAPESLRLLARLGAKPLPNREALLNKILFESTKANALTIVLIGDDGNPSIAPVVRPPTPWHRLMPIVLRLFGRSPVLPTNQPNPLSTVRDMVEDRLARHIPCATDLRTNDDDDNDVDRRTILEVLAARGAIVDAPPDDLAPRAWLETLARGILAWWRAEHGDWRDDVRTLLDAGYSPEERARAWCDCANAGDNVSERALIESQIVMCHNRAEIDMEMMVSDVETRPTRTAHAVRALNALRLRMLLEEIRDLYQTLGRPAPTASFWPPWQ